MLANIAQIHIENDTVTATLEAREWKATITFTHGSAEPDGRVLIPGLGRVKDGDAVTVQVSTGEKE